MASQLASTILEAIESGESKLWEFSTPEDFPLVL